MLSKVEKKLINELYSQSSDRYPIENIYVFRGKMAFNLHAKMVHLVPDWLNSFTDDDIDTALMIITINKTVSSATLKNPERQPAKVQRRLKIKFYILNGAPISSATSYSGPHGKKWLKIINDNIAHSIYRA